MMSKEERKIYVAPNHMDASLSGRTFLRSMSMYRKGITSEVLHEMQHTEEIKHSNERTINKRIKSIYNFYNAPVTKFIFNVVSVISGRLIRIDILFLRNGIDLLW